MAKLSLGLVLGLLLGALLWIPAKNRAQHESLRARTQLALYYCLASDMEKLIQKHDPDWYWWDAAERPVVDCNAVFDYWYAENQKPAEMAWLEVAP